MRFLVIAFSLFCLNPTAYAVWDFTVLMGANYATPSQVVNNVPQELTGTAAFAWGLFAARQIFRSRFTVETGLLFVGSYYTLAGATTQNLQETQIPVLIHFHFDDTVRVGAGLYTSWSGQSTPSTIGSADSGLLFDLRARLRLAAKFSLVGDARYQLGLTNRASTTTDTFKTRSVQVMGGVEVSI